MTKLHFNRAAILTCALAVTYSAASFADDMASFATAGYARGLRSAAMMHKIDTDRDGTPRYAGASRV